MKNWFKVKWQQFRMWIYGLLLAIGVVATPLIGTADDISLTYTNATTYEDGTPLQVGDIAQTCFKKHSFALGTDVSTQPRSYTLVECVAESSFQPGAPGSYTDANQPDGIHCYVATHITQNGIESQDSNESCRSIDLRRSGSPTGLQAN